MKKDLRSFFGELSDDGQILPLDETVVGRVVQERWRVVILVLYAQADCGAPPFSVHKRRQRVDAQLKGREIRARIFKLLRGPRIDSKESITPACLA